MQLPERAATLEGTRVRLEPIDQAGLEELAPALWREDVFAGGFGGGVAAFRNHDSFAEWFDGYRPSGDESRTYLVRFDGRAVGTTSFYNADYRRESVVIGYTAYSPDVWGTTVNPEAKRAMLSAAFDGGAHRVVFEVDNLNDRSRAAVTKLGAHLDGILREDRPRADGSKRSTVVFSILEQEWPEVRAGLDARVGD
ncbi:MULTISPECIES: GNAT family N-acetyltransferase [Gulosibacter]|uniref:GNAT family N-acetyltransferase n=1 Tax=Gulosibacter TaxID=256818 RepID=UPI000F62DB98|nr:MULTISPECIES: GNAT family protein [Gulosibacter]